MAKGTLRVNGVLIAGDVHKIVQESGAGSGGGTGVGDEILLETGFQILTEISAVAAIQAQTGDNIVIREDDGSAVLTVDTSGVATFTGNVNVGTDDVGHDVKFYGDTASKYWMWDTSADGVVQAGTIKIKEQADADSDTAAYGQIWVNTATPNELYFTTDAGNDIQLTTGTRLAATPADGAQIFNESGADVDFRIESDDNANMFFVDGGNDRVGIGTNAPNKTFEISAVSPTLRLNSTEGNVGNTDILGQIDWKSADAGRGGDPIAYIRAVSASADGSTTEMTFGTQADANAAAERMRIDDAGNVGIGSTAPDNLLHLNGTTDPQLKISGSAIHSLTYGHGGHMQLTTTTPVGDGNVYRWSRNSGSGMAEQMRIDTSGNVGIGTTAPGSLLQIASSSAPILSVSHQNASIANGTASSGIEFEAGTSDTVVAKIQSFIAGSSENASDLTFWTNDSATLTRRMTILNDGNVGIGTSAPSKLLDIRNNSGTVAIEAIQQLVNHNGSNGTLIGRGAKLHFVTGYSGGGPSEVGQIGAWNAAANWTTGARLGFRAGNSPMTTTNPHMVIDGNGYVGIGSTAPTAPLDVGATTGGPIGRIVQATSSSQSLYVKNSSGSFNNNMQYMSTELNDSAAGNFIYCSDSNDGKFRVNTNGDGYWHGSADNGDADYAEYFEADSDNSSAKISHGTTVVLINGKIRPATSGEQPIGITRPHDGVAMVGNSAWSRWQRKGLRDDYGKRILEEYTTTVWTDADGELHDVETDKLTQRGFVGDKAPPADAVVKDAYTDEDGITRKLTRNKQNPDWDNSHTYVQREDRPEWNIVGLLGQIPITKGQPTNSNWIKMWDISDTVEMWFVK